MAEKESNNNKKVTKNLKIKNILKIFSIPRKIIIISIIAFVVIFVLLPAIIKYITIEDGKENSGDPQNGPAAANEFINNVYLDENGNLKLEKSIGEFWDEMKQKGNKLTQYLNSANELAKLFSASIATDYPDTRPDPDEPIDWEQLDLDTDSTDVQGIIKFKRALSSGDKITMTYLPASEFQEKIDKYNDTGKEEDKEEAMKYFTLEKTTSSENSSTGDNNFIQDETTMTIDFANIICAGRAREKISAHGDITMIGSDGHYLLIDTSEGYLRKSVTKFLKDKNYADKEFDILITHNHSDHWGNAEYLMNNYKIGTLYLPEGSESKYSSLERVANNRRINVKRLKQNDTFNIGKAKLEVLYNPHNEITNNNSVTNNKSLITRISVPTLNGKEIRFLTCGDAEKLLEKELLKKGIDLKADIFKLNHHCMNTSNTEEFIGAVQPKYTVSNWWQDTSNQFPRTESTNGVKTAGKYGIVYSVIYNNSVKFSVSNHGVIIPEIYDNKQNVPYVFKDRQGNVIGTFNLQIPKDSHVRSYNPKKELNGEQLQALTQYFSDYARSGGASQNTNGTQNTPEGAKVITVDMDYSNTTNNNLATSSSTGSTSGNSEKVQEILKYACLWKGKVKYEKGKHEELKEGAKESCSGFVFRVYEYFNLMSTHKNAKEWKNGVPGTVEIGKDLSKASPGDIIWKQNSDDCHISIYLGNEKRIHSSPGNEGVGIGKIEQSSVHKIFHFTALPQNPKAYFDPETGILHSSNNSSSNTSTENSSSGISNTNSSSISSSSSSSNSSSGSSRSGQAIVDEAEKYVGKLPYVWGGYSLTTGADCSGFCWAILNKLGLYTGPHTYTVGFESLGTEVSDFSKAQAGDMIIYGPAKGQSNHMAIYDGKGSLIHELNESLGCKHTGNPETWGHILTIRRFVDSNSSDASRTYNNDVFNTEKSTAIDSQQNMPVPRGSNRTYRAVQSACYDGKYVICAQNKNYKDSSGNYSLYASSKGGRIAWFNMETGNYEKSIEIGSEGGHMDGVAYDSQRNMVLKPVSSEQGNLLQIDNNTKEIAGYTKMSDYCNKLTYLPTKNQLVGLKDGKFIFMSYRESENKYVKDNEVKLDDYHTNCGAQGIGTDGQCIYIADSGPNDSSSEYRVWTYTLDGKKVEEHGIGDVQTDSKEVESAFGDNNGNLWLVLPRGIEKVLNYSTNSTGLNGDNSSNNNFVSTYVVKVATWQESSEVVKSTDSSEDRNEHNHNMSTKTIPYQNAIAQYRMPFNYLWAMLLISQEKDYTFGLADLVRNSKIEITIHDNLEETTTKVTETYDQNYIYTGSADINMECMDVPDNETDPNTPQPIVPPTFNITENGSGEYTETSTYKKETTTINKVNTLDVALTLADTWCVKYEKEYEYNGEQTDNSNSTETVDVPKVEGEEENKITNANLLNKIIEDAKEKMNAERVSPAIVINSEVVAGTEKQTIDIEATTKEIKTEVTTVKSNYTGKPENVTEDTKGDGRFVDLFINNYKARSNILSTKDWLFEILESNEDTVNMVDLTKYLIYRATDTAIDEVTTYSFSEYDLNNFIDANGNSSNSIYGNTFEEKVWYTLSEKYSEIAVAGAMGNFAQESGFKSNNLQNGYESILGHSDESYTAAVNNGSYSRDKFIKDEAGYGLAQWTYWNRKAGLYDLAKQEGTGIDNEETQIKFLLKEIEKNCHTWQNSNTVSEATLRFHNEMEKSNDSPSELQKRVKSAEELYNKYKGKKRPASAGTPGTFPRYYQSDSRWASKRYGPDSMAEAGCGACALAMAVSGLTGRTVEPPEIVDYLNSKGIATAYEAEGTNASRAIANKYNLTLEVINKSDKSKIDEALDQGKVCMFSISYSGIYNDAVGHYILCYKKDNRGYYIVESGKYYDSNTPYTWSQTMGASNNGGMVNVLGK